MEFVSGTPEWVKQLLMKESDRTGIPTILMSALLKQESGFQTNVTSHAGAGGIAQFIPSTARAYGLRVDNQIDERTDPNKAIPAMANYLANLLNQYGSIERALSGYNSGKPDAYKDPSFSRGETHNYVKNIKRMAGYKGALNKINLEANKRKASGQPGRFTGTIPGKPTPEQAPDEQSFWEKIMARFSTEPISPLPETQEHRLEKKGFKSPLQSKGMQTLQSMNIFSPPSARASAPRTQSRGLNYTPIQNPSGKIPSPSFHIVKRGETLSGIAQQSGLGAQNWRQLGGYTGDPRKLPIGTQLSIPT